MRKSLRELLIGQPGPPKIDGIVDVFLRDAKTGEILEHQHKRNLITEYHRILLGPNSDYTPTAMYVFINENSEAMHPKRTSMRTTLPGVWAMTNTPTIDGPNRIWTYQVVFAAPPSQRVIRTIGLARGIHTINGYTNLKNGIQAINAATVLSSPITQTTSATLEVSYRLAIQRS